MREFAVPVSTGTGAEQAIDADLDAAADVLHRDPGECAALLHRAREALRGRRDPERVARHDQIQGDLRLAVGDPSGAARSYRTARRGWLAAGRALEVRVAALGRTRVMAAMGEYVELVPLVSDLQAGLEDLTDADERLVTRVHLMAHRQLGEAQAALGRFDSGKRHLDLAEDLAWDLQDLHAVGDISRVRGGIFIAGGLLHRAVDELRRARRAFLDAGSVPAVAETLIMLADALAAMGDVAPAMAVLDAADEAANDNPWAAAERDVVRAGVLLRAGLAAEALELSRAAEDAFVDLGLMERSARASFVSATALLRLERHEEAETELLLAEQLFSGSGARSMRDTSLLRRAQIALESGDAATAERIAARIVDGSDLAAPRGLEARARILLARATADLDLAERMLEEAAGIASRLSHVQLRLELRLGRARHLRRTGRPRESVTELRRALEVGRHRAGRASEGGQDADEFPLREATDELIVALVEDGGHAALIEGWQRSRAARAAALGPLIHQARGWQIRSCPAREGGAEDRSDPQSHGHAMVDIDVERLLADVQSQAALPPVEDALPVVPEGPVLDFYVVGADVVAFVIREGQVHARMLAGAAAESRHLVRAWKQECLLAAVVAPTAPSSAALDGLYMSLVAPLSDLLGDLEGESLDVVTDEHLHGAPFDALLDVAGPWRRRLAGALQGAPSAAQGVEPDPAHLAAGPGRARPVSALVLAVPDHRAPLIAREAVMVAAAMPEAELFVGDAATSKVLTEHSGRADVVHVAAHGMFRQGNPLFSAVRLGDGWLRAVDLVDSDVRLDGSVVVLSACGSGLATDRTPQPLGLAWAFLRAGAGGVVAALWDIDDEVTLVLMTHFYQRLEQGDHPRVALGVARRAVAERYPHPYYWAPFRYFTPS